MTASRGCFVSRVAPLFARIAAALAAAAYLIGGGTGCGAIGTYLGDRGRDLSDILTLGASFGPGVDLSVRATKLAQIGGGIVDESTARTGFGNRYAGSWHEGRFEAGVSFLYAHRFKRIPLALSDLEPLTQEDGPLFFPPSDLALPNDRDFYDVGATVHAGYLGIDIAVRPLEIVDLVTGIFTFDLVDDDRLRSPVAKRPAHAQPSATWKERSPSDVFIAALEVLRARGLAIDEKNRKHLTIRAHKVEPKHDVPASLLALGTAFLYLDRPETYFVRVWPNKDGGASLQVVVERPKHLVFAFKVADEQPGEAGEVVARVRALLSPTRGSPATGLEAHALAE